MAAPAPQLTEQQFEAAHAPSADLVAETDGRDRFAASAPEDLLLEAGTFPRYRLTTMPIIRQTDLMARRMFLHDLRELGRMSSPELQLIMQLLSHSTPGRPESRQREGPPV